jgi:hypothetical protein
MATKKWIGTDSGNEGDLNTAANWSPSGVPTASDDVYFGGWSTQAVTGSLTALSAVALTSMTIYQDYTGTIGTEDSFMECDPGTLRIGDELGNDSPSGSGRLNLDLGSNQQTVHIVDTATSATDSGRSPVRLKLNHASNAVTVSGGAVSLEDDPSDSGQISTLTVDGDDAEVVVGEGCTTATATVSGGDVRLFTMPTTLHVEGGQVETIGSATGTITTANVRAGSYVSNHVPSSGAAITTLNADGGTTDFLQNDTARTVTTVNLKPGATVAADPDVMTFTNGVALAGNLPIILSAA